MLQVYKGEQMMGVLLRVEVTVLNMNPPLVDYLAVRKLVLVLVPPSFYYSSDWTHSHCGTGPRRNEKLHCLRPNSLSRVDGQNQNLMHNQTSVSHRT